MVSKRRKTTTLRKKQHNQRKRSHRVRRGNRFQIGGNIPDGYIPLSRFGIPFANLFLTPEQIIDRQNELSTFKKNLDTFLITNSGKYTPNYFKEYVIDAIDKSPKFKTYQYYYSTSTPLRTGITNSFTKKLDNTIWPRIKEYINAGFTPEELLRAELPDITINAILDVKTPSLSVKDLEVWELHDAKKRAEFQKNSEERENERIEIQKDIIKKLKEDDVNKLFNAKKIKQLGFSISPMKNSGFSDDDIIEAGFTLKELKSAGYTAKQLKSSFLFRDFIQEKYTLTELKDAGFTAKEFKDYGIHETLLKRAGFILSELTNSGYTLKELFDAGYIADEFIATGYTLKDLKDGGVTAEQLKKAGFDLEKVIKLRTIPDHIKDKPYDKRTQNTTGYHLIDLANAGYDLITEKYNIVDIFKTGLYTYGEIKDVIDLYKTDTETKQKVEEIKRVLTDLKDEVNNGKPMCERGIGIFVKGATDPNCLYNK